MHKAKPAQNDRGRYLEFMYALHYLCGYCAVLHRLISRMLKMNKLLSMLAVAAFSMASVGAFAGSHGGAMSDKEKAELTEKCAKMDPAKADDKMKADCKKLKEMKK